MRRVLLLLLFWFVRKVNCSTATYFILLIYKPPPISFGFTQMKVLIVGAGASGLPSLKTSLEHGFEAICMEMSNDIGGLWRFKESPKEGFRRYNYIHLTGCT